jgi:hypothetical protein
LEESLWYNRQEHVYFNNPQGGYMTKKTMFLVGGLLQSMYLLPAAGDSITFLLERIVTARRSRLKIGSSSMVIFAGQDVNNKAVNGLLPFSSKTQLEKNISITLSHDEDKPGFIFGLDAGRFALLQKSIGARTLKVRTYGESPDAFEDQDVEVEGLSKSAHGLCPIAFSFGEREITIEGGIKYGAVFKCWSTHAGIGTVTHMRPSTAVPPHSPVASAASPFPYDVGYAMSITQPVPYGMGYAPSAPSN